MSTKIVLKWSYTPQDYFEEPVDLSESNFQLVIDNGVAEATLDDVVYDSSPSIRQDIDQRVEGAFSCAGVFHHKAFDLSGPNMTRIHSDGRRDRIVECVTEKLIATVGSVDIKITDKHGNVIEDTARDRRLAIFKLAQLGSRYFGKDPTLDSLLSSYKSAVDDPSDELVHLYEIRDALSKKFGGNKATREALRISKSDWDRLGILANVEPLRQGRHRGQKAGVLRNATEAELAEARGIAQSMIKSYLSYLDAQP